MAPAPAMPSRAASGFDFTRHVLLLCRDLATRVDDLAHVDMSQVGVSLCRSRASGRHGLLATLTPLRFEGGSRVGRRRGRRYTVQCCLDESGRELLYVLSLYLPRFCAHSWRDKLATIVHELWHVGPRFDGDLRRFTGRCFAHGRSQRSYDAHVEKLVERYLAAQPPDALLDFLHDDFDELVRRHRAVVGTHYPLPKLIPLEAA